MHAATLQNWLRDLLLLYMQEPPKEKTPPPKEQTPPPEDPCPKSPPPVHRCPSDVEAERPKYFTESITGEGTWKQYGVRIQYTDPVSPGTSSTKVGKPLTVTLGLEVKESCCLTGDVITAYMWTHMKTMCNPCGTWKDLPLHFQPDQSSIGECNVKRYVYKSTVTPTEDDVFRLTFNVKWGNIMIWANNYGDDNMLYIFGHVMRREKLENLVTTGMLEGKRSRGKQREKLIEGLTDWLKAGKSLEAIEATKDRKKWRTMIANAVKQGT
ncbi:hypothetical protein PoB_003669200 [Plakobranchus ocellatus]|uniref:Uncharacterized protein n=1 Tax=Plakobranchus ocellatus TaxID=259542 RepID=A0AAV4ATD3_9GAST|nr:hypothetical protein PoB_003669200 [Plakobranchus ocellatus]